MTTKRPITNDILSLTVILAGTALISSYNFLIYHYIVELFSIVIGAMIFVIVWNNRSRITDAGLLIIGISYLFVAGVDLFHTLAYTGTGLFDEFAPDLPTQLWVVARVIEASSLVIGIASYGRRGNPWLTVGIYSIATVGIVILVYPLRLFPTAFVTGRGLTPFKIATEYTVVGLVTIAGALLVYWRKRFSREAWPWFVAAIAATIVSELLFTVYLGVYDLVNVLGHFAKTVSFYAMYKAFVVVGIREPSILLYQQLTKREEELVAALGERDLLIREVHHRVKNNIQLVLALVAGEEADASPEVQQRLRDLGNRIQTVQTLHDRLSRTEGTMEIELVGYLNDIAQLVTASTAPRGTNIEPSSGSILIASGRAIPIAMIVSEILTNIFKHSIGLGGNGTVGLSVTLGKNGSVEVDISDTGARFVEARPAAGATLGRSIVSALVDQLSGTLQRDYRESRNHTVLTAPVTVGRS